MLSFAGCPANGAGKKILILSLLDTGPENDYHIYGKTNRSYERLTLRTLKGEEL